ncbi:MAG: hypothetical protein AAF773_00985 [Cyanobacteria bacterium P01_D01_bin.115]
MVTITEPVDTAQNQAEQVEQLRQEYEAAGVTPIIAASAAQVKLQQQTGGPIDEIDQEILAFADQTLIQQQQLETLSAYRQSLEAHGFGQAAAEYAHDISDIQALTTSEAVESRQVSLAADLKERGIEPHVEDTLQEKVTLYSSIRLQSAATVAMGRAIATSPNASEVGDGPMTSLSIEETPALAQQPEQQMLSDAQTLMDNAREAGIVVSDQGVSILEGGHYCITQQGGMLVIEGDGKKLIADSGEVLKAEGFGIEDYERFSRLGQRSPEALSEAVAQSQTVASQRLRSQRERQREVQRGQRMELT